MPPECHEAAELHEALAAGVTMGLHEFLALPAMLGDDLRMIYAAVQERREKHEHQRDVAMLKAMAGRR